MPVRQALRASLTDFYFNSWRLAPANVIWGAVLLLALFSGPTTVVGVLLLVVLSLPTVGLYRMAALMASGRPAAFADFVEAIRRWWLPAMLAGIATAGLAAVFATNVALGLHAGNPIGWFLSAMALWGLVGLAMLAVAFWPLLVDPEREDRTIRQRLLLGGLAVIGRPLRLAILTAFAAVLLVVSTALFALIVMVSIAYLALVSAHVVLPVVDELEARLPEGRRL
jgi:uncharacterized membrane protein YesL